YTRADTNNGPDTGTFTVITVNGQCGGSAPISGKPLQNQKDLGAPKHCGVGNPCNPANGNKYQAETDYRREDATLSFIRSYNSNGGKGSDSGLGFNWISLPQKRLEIYSPVMQVRRADG